MTKICSVKHCYSSTDNSQRRFFHFPRNKIVFQKWRDFCEDPTVKVRSRFCCDLHFRDEDFFGDKGKARLIRGSVPSIKNTKYIEETKMAHSSHDVCSPSSECYTAVTTSDHCYTAPLVPRLTTVESGIMKQSYLKPDCPTVSPAKRPAESSPECDTAITTSDHCYTASLLPCLTSVESGKMKPSNLKPDSPIVRPAERPAKLYFEHDATISDHCYTPLLPHSTTVESKKITQSNVKPDCPTISQAERRSEVSEGCSKRSFSAVEASSDENQMMTMPLIDDDSQSESVTSSVNISSRWENSAAMGLEERLSFLQTELYLAITSRDSSVCGVQSHQKDFMRLYDEILKCKTKLLLIDKLKINSHKNRSKERKKMRSVANSIDRNVTDSDASNEEISLAVPGTVKSIRPHFEKKRPGLYKAIVDMIIMFGAFGGSEALRRCKTYSDLHLALNNMGFKLSVSDTYIRWIPIDNVMIGGKRHVTTEPVKGAVPTDNDKGHPDENFSEASIETLETIASVLGPHQVIFLAQINRVRVPLGLSAADKQAPLLMHVEYEVKLPDHDWIIADKHKLIPSVYAFCPIRENCMGLPEAISYSGPTYIAVRSGKHSLSTSSAHASDFKRLLEINCCREIMTEKLTGHVKPVVMISTDGGPDGNPRYPKVIAHSVSHFRNYNLDAIFVFTGAPGREPGSLHSRVGRRIIPLSEELTGLILPRDCFGSHLDGSGKTLDPDLELRNFIKAGKVLSEIWSSMVLDNHPVVAEFHAPDSDVEKFVPSMPDSQWYSRHVRESQYLLQIIKCSDEVCCSKPRSGLWTLLKDGFLLPPFPLLQTPSGPIITGRDNHDGRSFAPYLLRRAINLDVPVSNGSSLPYDFYCPSIRNEVEERTCPQCFIYFCSKKAVAEHNLAIHSRIENHHTSNNSEILKLETPHANFKEKLRPWRILSRRHQTNELLCLESESASRPEWFPANDIQLMGNELNSSETPPADIQIVSLEEKLKSPCCNVLYQKNNVPCVTYLM